MDKLWAPWRINYIKAKKVKGCIFCRAQRGKDDKKNFVLLRSKKSFVILNTFPYNNGHLMVVSNRHVPSLEDLTDQEIIDINQTAIKIIKRLKKVLKPQGYNIGINSGECAGAGIVDHFHLHIVPRWNADTNFMPITAETKVIVQSLQALYKSLSER